MDEKIPFDFINILKPSMWSLFTATLIDTPIEEGGYKKLRGKKDAFTEDENSLFLNIPKKYYEWLHLFRKDAVTLF